MEQKSKKDFEQEYIDDMVEGRIYTVEEVASRLHKSIWSVRSYIRDGLLAATKQGRHYVVPHTALRQYVVQNIVAPPTEDRIQQAASRPEPVQETPEPVEADPEPESVEEDPVEDVEEEAEQVIERPTRPTRPTSFAAGDF